MTHSFATPTRCHPTFVLRNKAPNATNRGSHSSKCAIANGACLSDDCDTAVGFDTLGFTRRDAIILTTAGFTTGLSLLTPPAFAEQPVPDPTRMAVFVDAKNLFRVEYPETWVPVNKAGATLLLRDPSMKYSQIGVTVSPVRIRSLGEFGTAHEIGEKLLNAEAAKESTYPGGVTLVDETERVGKSGATFYEYEYRLVTTRGNKKVFSSVAVENNTLFIMNAQVFEKNDDASEEEKNNVDAVAETLRRVVRLFDVGKESVDNT